MAFKGAGEAGVPLVGRTVIPMLKKVWRNE